VKFVHVAELYAIRYYLVLSIWGEWCDRISQIALQSWQNLLWNTAEGGSDNDVTVNWNGYTGWLSSGASSL